ncbi:MAG TPA: MgtC/SapB family protein [Clostridiaceae bacterium]|nr:MgtC/SapB family protein [Clostridiaceae bacterium]
MSYYLVLLFRLFLACILGGLIGFEREHTNRPAGFRTHILVCVGSSLVMITSEFIFNEYSSIVNLDPARLGAQVISGIGFLGAGTIIRDGFNVRGLTTAASLWAVSAVGIAVGIGFYEGAVFATVIIYLTLILLKKMELSFAKKKRHKIIYIQADNIPGRLAAITSMLDKLSVIVRKIDFVNDEEDESVKIKLLVRLPSKLACDVVSKLTEIEGVHKVYEE